jgi:hypothetical protein
MIESFSLCASEQTYDMLQSLQPGVSTELLDFSPPDHSGITSLYVTAEAGLEPFRGRELHLYSVLKVAKIAIRPTAEVIKNFCGETRLESDVTFETPGSSAYGDRVVFVRDSRRPGTSHIQPLGGGNHWLAQSRLYNCHRFSSTSSEDIIGFVDNHISTLRSLIFALTDDVDESVMPGYSFPLLKLTPSNKPETTADPETISYGRDPFEEFVGMEEVVNELKTVVKIANHGDRARQLGLDLVQSILLYGPSGVGKTALMRSLGAALDATIVAPSIGQIGSKYISEHAGRLQAIFDKAKRSDSRTLIMLDELDGLVNTGNEGVDGSINAVLKQELENLSRYPQVFFVAATNHVDLIDPNVRASKRIPVQIPISLPDDQQRASIFKSFLLDDALGRIDFNEAGAVSALEESEGIWNERTLDDLSRATDNFSGGEIRALVMEAKRRCLIDSLDSNGPVETLELRHVMAAVERAKRTKA